MRFIAFCFALVIGLTAAPVLAQNFGSQGDVAFSADRLFAVHSTHIEEERDAPLDDVETDVSGVGFGWRGPFQPSPYDVPRFAFDIFVTDGLNIGASIAYASLDIDVEGNEGDGSAFLFAPRVGYVWMFGRVGGFWLRGGLTYHSYNADSAPLFGYDESGLAVTAEPTFVIAPVQHFAFLIGGTLDLSLTGSRDRGNVENDVRYRVWGLQFGLMGWI
jgi:hypothetical protein